ncbi:MAG TPA: hypothetical protein VJB05_00705 [archaeon]|nr:hypothetical protein [archaeon]
MITSLNPGIALIVAVLALFGLEAEISSGNGIGAFFLGAVATVPLIVYIWEIMKKNWTTYRKFYSMSFHKRNMNVIKRSWTLTWWIIPYSLVVYSILDLTVLLNPRLGTPYSMLYGALFVIFFYTALQKPKYYESIKKK